MNKASKWILAVSMAIGNLLYSSTAQANPVKDFYKIELSSSEYSNITGASKSATTHCVFLNLRNLSNQSRQLTQDEITALRYNITLVDKQNRAYDGQVIVEEDDEMPHNYCFQRKIKNRPDIAQCIGAEAFSAYGKRGCYLLRFDTPMRVQPSYLQLEPLKGTAIKIRL
jgi:hypothetical protein